MNLGRRIEFRLAEMGKTRAFLFQQVPGLLGPALSLAISRDSKRCKWDVEIAQALGVRLAWLRTGLLPKLTHPDCDENAFSQQIADLVLDGQSVQVCPNKSGLYWAAKLEENYQVAQTVFDLFENFPEMDEWDDEDEIGIRPKEDGTVIPFRREGE